MNPQGAPCPAPQPVAPAVGTWLRPLGDWLAALCDLLEREPAVVRVVLAQVRGSAPREAGVGMLVGARQVAGTIGGGRLEWEAIGAARGLLDRAAAGEIRRLVLGAELGQCCGGVVELWMERYSGADRGILAAARRAAQAGAAVLVSTLTPRGVERSIVRETGRAADANRLPGAPCTLTVPRLERDAAGRSVLRERLDQDLPAVWLVGAGHVGQALARILMDLPLRLTWIDPRPGVFPADLPVAVRTLAAADPVQGLAAAPPGGRFLVMSHSHALDYAICRALLHRNDFASLGLIGSASKSARFRARLARDGLGADAIARLVCPIGIDGIGSKWPAAIAVGVAAQLLREIGAGAADSEPRRSAMPCTGFACESCGSP
ncbi:MAG: xanthine dehydrogenase accessory protein XdhC [Steroidobacteraceae bacterium]|jgi:xanthine dehydrogenase accessory factor